MQFFIEFELYSLQDDDYEHGTFMDDVNYLSCTAGRRPSILATLAQELGPKQERTSSPVLEQTSVADFIRVLSQLQSRLENSEFNIENVMPNDNKNLNQSSPFSFSARSTPIRRSKSKKEMFHSTSALTENDEDEAVNPSLIKKDVLKRRRFSFIPQIDKFPCGKVNSEENVSIHRKKSRSHSITPNDSIENSNTNVSVIPNINKKLRRMSTIGLNLKPFRKISIPQTKPQQQTTITPPKLVITSPEGDVKHEFDRFTVTQMKEGPSRKQSTSSGASVSWGTGPSSNEEEVDKEMGENLEDVVVLRL